MQRRSIFSNFLKHAAWLGAIGLTMLSGCTKDNPANPNYEDDEDTWTMTIDVIDGFSGERLADASVTYVDREGNDKTAKTNEDGRVVIDRLAPGEKSFRTAYTEDEDVLYTEVSIKAQGRADESSPTGDLLDRSEIVKLFPRTGALKGTIHSRVHEMSAKTPAESVSVTITFNDTAMANANARTLSTITGEDGVFAFEELPLAGGIVFSVSNALIDGIVYQASTFTQPTLVPNSTIPMASIIMYPADANAFNRITSAPSIIRPNDPIDITFSGELDTTVTTSRIYSSTNPGIYIAQSIVGNKITVTPLVSLVDGETYSLEIIAYGVEGGVEKYTAAMSARDGGLVDIVSSNVLDKSKNVVDGLALTDSISFTFSDSVTRASVGVKKGSTPVLVSPIVSGGSVTIPPPGKWESTTYTIKVNVDLANGTSTEFTINVTTEGGLNFVESNVFTPTTGNFPSPINGILEYDDTIKVVTNKPVTEVTAVLNTNGGSRVTTSTELTNNTEIAIVAINRLLPSQYYNLTLTAKTATGEIRTVTVSNILTASSDVYPIRVVSSNVMSIDGKGLTGVSPSIQPYYVLSSTGGIPDAAMLEVRMNENGTSVPVIFTVSEDTVKLVPARKLKDGSVIDVNIEGMTTNGDMIDIDLSAGNFDFEIAKGAFVVATNLQNEVGDAREDFPLYGQIWIKFSDSLDSDISKIEYNATAGTDILAGTKGTASGAPNAVATINGDTLFLQPDNRVSLTYGTLIGVDVTVTLKDGRTFTSGDLTATIVPNDFYIVSTNTKDALGNVLETFKGTDTIMAVVSVPISEITAVTDAGTDNLPFLSKEDISLSATGDTIWYVPSVQYAYDKDYAIQITADLTNGAMDQNVTMNWGTIRGIETVAVNNRENGMYRPFRVIGDTLVVTFSKAVDVDADAKVPFAVTGFGTSTPTVIWSNGNKTAQIVNVDTLNAAQFTASNPYTSNSTQTHTVSIEGIATDGEEFSFGGADAIPVHTEWTIWLSDASVLQNVVSTRPVQATTNGDSTSQVAVDAGITLTFNRAVDTATIKLDATTGYANYITLTRTGSTVRYDFAASFSPDGKTITLAPVDELPVDTDFEITLKGIPAVGIKEAYDGVGTGRTLIDGVDFKTVDDEAIESIAHLTCALFVDTVPASNMVAGNRYGYSPNTVDVADGRLNILVQQTGAWGEMFNDSVDGYMFAVSKGGSFYELQDASNVLPAGTYDSWKSPSELADDQWNKITLDLTNETDIYNANYLLTPDKDGTGGKYMNGNDLFNDSTVISIKAIPYLIVGSKTLLGTWSNVITFADNVAPGDSDFNQTSVSLNDYVDADRFSLFGDWDNFHLASAHNDSIYVRFPEDMTVTGSVPRITFFDGLSTSFTAPDTTGAGSRWVDGRTYRLGVNLAANTAYNTETLGTALFEGTTLPTGWSDVSGSTAFQVSTPSTVGPTAAWNGSKCLASVFNGYYNSGAARTISTQTKSYTFPAGGGNWILEFAFWLDLDGGDDVALQFTTDGGTNWYDISNNGMNGSLSGSPLHVVYSVSDGNTNTFRSQLGSGDNSDNSADWKIAQVNIGNNWAGSTVAFRFVLTDNGNSNNDAAGFYMDNFRLYQKTTSWYYSVDVSGMKDGSGITLQPTGHSGGASGTTKGSVTTNEDGNRNVDNLRTCN